MDSTYSVTQAQTNLPRLIKEAADEGSIAITRHEETVAYLISRSRMDAIIETLDLLGNPAAMKALRDYEAGKTKFLPLSALPQVDYPTIQVQTFYPGASPEVMTSSITAPLEVQFGQMPGLNQMSSTSSGGASVITLQFSLTLSLDIAEQEVQAAINAAGNLLPSDLPCLFHRFILHQFREQ